MLKKRFNLGNAFAFVFQSFRKYPLLLMVPIAIESILSTLFTFGNDSTTNLSKSGDKISGLFPVIVFGNLLLFVMYFLLISIVYIGIFRMGIKLYIGYVEPTWKDFSKLDWQLIRKYIFTMLLFGLYIAAALLISLIPGAIIYLLTKNLPKIWMYLLISPFTIPAIIIYITYTFVAPITVDTKSKIYEVFQKSADLSRGIKWYLFGYFLLTSGVSYFVNSYFIHFKKIGFVWLYYSSNLLFTFLWTCIFVLIPIYLYKDLARQQAEFDQANKEMIKEESVELKEGIVEKIQSS